MAETKIFIVSRRWPQTLLCRFGRGLRLAPGKAGQKILRTYELIREKQTYKKG
ncbi:hypothetical protein [Pelotomaculum propionicicum]|uniref:hypothetical protein n=1 Tax=Pelotomaculum propionicicum TaxID=258475 RepID=UPI00169F7952|nr:hypothetical protein [Pelotomaculum propionicicum]NLI14294.1 hypothetical protein [Peptococcaceae bacterium]